MSFTVDIAKTVGGSRRRFELRVAFETHARRTVIYGPSGAGKSLTLQAIAGLLAPDRGRILFNDETLFDSAARVHVPARARRFGYLFQDYALFPGLNVRQNVAFGLSAGLRNPPRDAGGAAVERWLDALELREAISIYGGYDSAVGWARTRDSETVLLAGLTVRGVATNLELQLLTVRSASASSGATAYGVRVVGSSGRVLLKGCTVTRLPL